MIERVGTYDIPPQPAVFLSRESFQEVGVKTFGGKFESIFTGFEVGAVEAIALSIHVLTEDPLDSQVRSELGRDAEISVSYYLAFLDGHRGSSERYLSYLKDRDSNLWPVNAHWFVDINGWFVRYVSAKNSSWLKGVHVVSLH